MGDAGTVGSRGTLDVEPDSLLSGHIVGRDGNSAR